MLGLLVLLTSVRVSLAAPWSPTEPQDQSWRLFSLREDADLDDRTVFNLDFERPDPRAPGLKVWLATSDGLREFDGYTWKRYGRTNGLPSDLVRCVKVTARGELWVGTDQGAGVFDGHRFDPRGSASGLAGPNIRRIAEDPDGTLWFCSDSWPATTAPGGITSLKDGQWRAYRAQDGLPSEYVVQYFRDSSGRRYALTLKGLAELAGDRWMTVLVPGAATRGVWSGGDLAEVPDEGMFFSAGSQLFRRQQEGWIPEAEPPDLSYGLVAASDGSLIAPLGTSEGKKRLARWSPFGWVPVSAEFRAPHDYLEEVREAPDGSIWSVGYDCLVRWEPRNSQWREFDLVPPPCFVDAAGQVWFARRSAIPDADNRPVRFRREGGREVWDRLEDSCPVLELDARGEVWGATPDQAIHWRGQTEERFDLRSAGLANLLTGQVDRRGRFWLIGPDATQTNLLRTAFHDGQRWGTRLLSELGPNPQLTAKAGTDEGLLLGFLPSARTDGGLARVGATNTVVEYLPVDFFSLFNMNLHEDRQGVIWLFGDNGLRRSVPGDPRGWQTVSNLLGGVVFAAVERADGMWFGCNGLTGGRGGVMNYDHGRWNSQVAEVLFNLGCAQDGTLMLGAEGHFGIVHPPGKGTRLLTFDLPEETSLRSMAKDSLGTYWLGTGDTVFAFRSDGFPSRTRVRNASTAVVRGQPLRIEFEAVERFHPRSAHSDHHYSWRIDGGQWSPLERQKVQLLETTPLSLGRHLLEVRSVDAGQDLDPTPATWAFRVYPVPLQSRAWFLPAAVGAILLLGLLAINALSARAKLAEYALGLEERITARTADLKADVLERQRVAEALRWANRELRVLTDCNQTLCRALDEDSLLREICRIVVETGGYALSAVCFAESDPGKSVRIVACHGLGEAAYRTLHITWDESPSGTGPTGTAIRTGRSCAVQDVLRDDHLETWSGPTRQLGHSAACALPLRDSDRRTFGALTVYSNVLDAFHQAEIDLLQELADDLAFGIGALRSRAAHGRAEAEVRASEERFRQLAENVHEVFWLADPERTSLIYVSPSFETLWGRPCAEVLANPALWIEATHPDDRERVLHALRTQAPLGAYVEEYRILRPDGSVRWIRDRASPIKDADGRVFRLAGFAEDISERQRLEHQLRQAQKMEAIGQLSGGIAHDFNNILGAIFGNIELARMDVGPDHPALESLEEVRKASERAKNLVQQILAFARRKPYERQPLDLGPILEESCRLLRATLPAGAELRVELARNLPVVLADSTQIQQLVLNLGTNAWHALEGQPGRIRVAAETVEVTPELAVELPALEPGRHVRIAVEDTGKGMDEHTLEHLFEPFFTTKPPGQGTGLGLSVVHGIMQSHRGAVTVSSRPGQGSTFHLYFPVFVAPVPEDTLPLPDLPAAGEGRRVLCLDDERPLTHLTTRMLERLGYQVVPFSEATEALRAFRAAPESFDLAVTDFNMPGMSGLDVARQLRETRPHLPIILSSGFISDDLVAQAREAGVHSLLQKPSGLEELTTAIQRALAATSPDPQGPVATANPGLTSTPTTPG